MEKRLYYKTMNITLVQHVFKILMWEQICKIVMVLISEAVYHLSPNQIRL